MNNIKKFIICPQVVVYPGILKNTEDVLKMIKKSEVVKEKIHNIPPSTPWNGPGTATKFVGPRGGTYEYEDEDSILQRSVLTNIANIYDVVIKDFFNEYKTEYKWPDFIKNWDLLNDNFWKKTGGVFLKYGNNNYEHDPVNGKYDLAMHFHTDAHSKNLNSGGPKHVLTVTMYLNDDYTGGEICYIDNATGKSYMYKPKVGDVTVFPSGEPFLHGVFPQYGSERYLLRMFLLYDFEGTEEWNRERLKYDKDTWSKMENKRLETLQKTGDTRRQIIFPGEKEDKYFIGEKIYMQEHPIKINIDYTN